MMLFVCLLCGGFLCGFLFFVLFCFVLFFVGFLGGRNVFFRGFSLFLNYFVFLYLFVLVFVLCLRV